jgi:hypothetical protein
MNIILFYGIKERIYSMNITRNALKKQPSNLGLLKSGRIRFNV